MRTLLGFAFVATILCPSAFGGETLIEFSGRGIRSSKSFEIKTGKATITATAKHIDPDEDHYTSVTVENEKGVAHGMEVTTLEGAGTVSNSTILRGKPGTYFIYVQPVGVGIEWRVVVAEGE